MKKWLKENIEENQYVTRSVERIKRISFPGLQGVSLYDVLYFFFRELGKDQVTMRAAAVSFFFLMAIFPFVLFFFTLIPYIPVAGFRIVLFSYLESILPHTAFDFLQAAIEDIVTIGRLDLLSLGFILTFYFSTSGVNALMISFNKVYPIFKKRSFLHSQLVAIKLTLLILILLLVSIILIIIGDLMLNLLAEEFGIGAWQYYILQGIRWIILVALYYTVISFIYYYGPSTTYRWKFASVGSTVATFLCLAVSLIFAFFVNNFDMYNKIYGSIGALIAVILWLYMNTLILLIGFELNASINFHKNLDLGA